MTSSAKLVLPRLASLSSAARPLQALALAGLLGLWGGCATPQEVVQPADTTKYTLENTDRYTALDRASQEAVACTGLLHHALADGRLEVVATLKNRAGRRVEVQASCAFKDEQGLTVEETAWKTVTLAENTSEAVRFTTSSAAAKKYTIRVRQGR